MCLWGVRTVFQRCLLLIAVFAEPCASICRGQSERPVGAGGSDDSEPVVILSNGSGRIPVREVSRAVQQSADPLHRLVWDTRETTRHRLLSTKDHTPWQIMHGLLGLRQDLLLSHNGQVVNALEWIQSGPKFQNAAWFEKTVHGGRAHPYIEPYWFEGHINQFVAMLASCNLPLDTKFGTPSGPITMQDMLKNAQMTVNAREEVTWTLWALCTYLPSDARWVNAAGEEWSIEKLVQLETGKTVGGPTSPCGGTHGLFALARARNVHLRSGKPLRGVWFAADQKIRKYIETAKVYRNSDGSLSSGFFKTREYKQDFDKRMASQGHLLEFLMMSVSQEELRSDWVRRAVSMTCNDLNANQNQYASCSPLFHAANALSIYLDRVAQELPPKVAQNSEGASGNAVQRKVQPTPPRPPKAEGAGGIAPPAPPARGNLQIPPAANAPTFAGEPDNKPKSPSPTDARYPVPRGTAPRPTAPAITSPAAKSPASTKPPVAAKPQIPSRPAIPGRPAPPLAPPPSAVPGAPITNPRGVPVKSVSNTKASQPATEKAPRPTPPVPPAPRPPAIQPSAAGKTSLQNAGLKATKDPQKTSANKDPEIMLLDEFLGSPPPNPSHPQRPGDKPKAIVTPSASPDKRAAEQNGRK